MSTQRQSLRVAIVGSRRRFMKDPDAGKLAVYEFVAGLDKGTTVISGAEPTGVDFWAACAARLNGLPLIEYPAKWLRPDRTVDRGAGFKRNALVEKDSDELHVFWESETPGTANTVGLFRKAGKKVVIHTW